MRVRAYPRLSGLLFWAGRCHSSLYGASLLCIPLHPFPAAQNSGYEHVRTGSAPASERRCKGAISFHARLHARRRQCSISSPIPRGSTSWVRARRASLALLPQRPRQNESSTGAGARNLGLDVGEQTLNAKGAGPHECWPSRRAAFVLSRATRSAIASMRASRWSSFCVSRHARIIPRPLQIRALRRSRVSA
jgi:hypothetical protein